MKHRLAALCSAIAVPVSAIVWLAASGSPAIESKDVTSTADRLPTSSIAADANTAEKSQSVAFGKDEIEPASGSVVDAANEISPASQAPEPAITVALGPKDLKGPKQLAGSTRPSTQSKSSMNALSSTYA
jgi:hypothetical protein